jgi:hypothetical protein
MKVMKVYVLLLWFWEGDGELVNSYVGVKRTKKEVSKLVTLPFKIYQPEEEIPDERSGRHGSPSFYQIIIEKI